MDLPQTVRVYAELDKWHFYWINVNTHIEYRITSIQHCPQIAAAFMAPPTPIFTCVPELYNPVESVARKKNAEEEVLWCCIQT